MFKKHFNLLKLLRKLSISGTIETINEIKPIPKSLKLIFFIFSFGSSKKQEKKSDPKKGVDTVKKQEKNPTETKK